MPSETTTTTTTTSTTTKVEQYNELMSNMAAAKSKWDAEKEDRDGYSDDAAKEDEQDRLLSQAIELALEQGRGWSPGEKEAYLEKILDDDFIPPLFCSNEDELRKTGLQEAFSSLIYDDETPTRLYLQFRQKGKDAFTNGKRNQASNLQYFRDAVNHYYEALACAQHIAPLRDGDLAVADTDDPTFTGERLDEIKSTLCSNIALAHEQLKNWGLCRDESKRALAFYDRNVKAWYRLAVAHQHLQQWEPAGDAVSGGLAVDPENKDLIKLQQKIQGRVEKARRLRQARERKRAERAAAVKRVWRHCQERDITLGRVPLVTSVTEDEEEEDDDDAVRESHWHHHLPHTGQLPSCASSEGAGGNGWSWPCMFLYPSHSQSDFVPHFAEDEMLAMRMAEMFPEPEDNNDDGQTTMPWDFDNDFTCSQLAVYFEVHNDAQQQQNKKEQQIAVHPAVGVERLRDLAGCMRFYEACRALLGDEGAEMAQVVRAVERKRLYKQRKAWIKRHKSLHCRPDPNPVVRVHPAMTLAQVLQDARMMVPNFLVTFFLFPEKHPAHESFLKEHKCIGVLQPAASTTSS